MSTSVPLDNQPQSQPQTSDRIADSLQNATISAPEPGLTGMLDRTYNRVRDFLGADHKPAGDVIGGIALGPIRAAKGVSQLPDHPVRGVNNIIGGVGQTIALPAAVLNPATMAYAAPAVATQQATQKGLNAIGVDPDYAELGGNIAGIAAGGLEAKPEIAGKALTKTGGAIVKAAPYVGKAANKAATFGGVGEFIHSGNPMSLAGPIIAPIAEKAATGLTRGTGNLLIKAGNAITPDTPVVESVSAAPEASPAPYRMSGGQITDAVTVTPKAPFVPKGLLPAAPVEDDAPATVAPMNTPASPKAAQTAILKKIGVASPAATIKPMTRVPQAEITPRPDLSFSGSNSGESAARNQLSENFSPDRLGINDLRGIAMARGIPVDAADGHATLIDKIQDSLTPEELDRFDQARIERMQPNYSIPGIVIPQQ